MSIVSCVVSDKFRFLVPILPKNASSTIRAELNKPAFEGHENVFEKLLPDQKTYKKAVFLRHPIERFLSAYHEVYCRHIGQGQYFEQHGINKQRTLHFLNMKDDLNSMHEFLDHIAIDGFFDDHINQQVDFLKDIPIDHYFSVENLQKDMQQLFQLLGSGHQVEPLPFFRKRRVLQHKRNFVYRINEIPDDLIHRIETTYAEDMTLYQKHIVAT